MAIQKKIKLGDYVHASRWADQDPDDPWCVGHVTVLTDNFVVVGAFSGRRWPNAVKITGDEGKQLLIDRGVYQEAFKA